MSKLSTSTLFQSFIVIVHGMLACTLEGILAEANSEPEGNWIIKEDIDDMKYTIILVSSTKWWEKLHFLLRVVRRQTSHMAITSCRPIENARNWVMNHIASFACELYECVRNYSMAEECECILPTDPSDGLRIESGLDYRSNVLAKNHKMSGFLFPAHD